MLLNFFPATISSKTEQPVIRLTVTVTACVEMWSAGLITARMRLRNY